MALIQPYVVQRETIARVEGAKNYNVILTNNIPKATYVDVDGERHGVYYDEWIGEAVRSANRGAIELPSKDLPNQIPVQPLKPTKPKGAK